MFDLEAETEAETYMSVDDCAAAMGISVEQVRRLIRLRVLRTRYSRGTVMVQPTGVPA